MGYNSKYFSDRECVQAIAYEQQRKEDLKIALKAVGKTSLRARKILTRINTANERIKWCQIRLEERGYGEITVGKLR